MARKQNDILPLILAFLITAGMVGAGVWWLTQKSGINLGGIVPGGGGPQLPQGAGANDFASVSDVPAGLFNYGGSTTWAPIRATVDATLQSSRPNFRLRYTQPVGKAPGSGTGIEMLLQGQLAFAQSSRPLKDSELQAGQQRGTPLEQIAVAIDGLAIAVHPQLNVPGLTVTQLRDIYVGKLTNWQQVGGPNLPIQAVTRPVEAGGTVEFFVDSVLDGADFGARVRRLATTTQALRFVARTPGAIYYASAPEVVPQCTVKTLPVGRQSGEWVPPYQEPLVPLSECPNRRNQLNLQAFQDGQYPLTRNLFVIVQKNGQIEEQAGLAYANLLLSRQGQQLIQGAGFVPIR